MARYREHPPEPISKPPMVDRPPAPLTSFIRRLIAATENAADAFTNAARRSVTLDRLIALQKQNLPNAISANIVIPLLRKDRRKETQTIVLLDQSFSDGARCQRSKIESFVSQIAIDA